MLNFNFMMPRLGRLDFTGSPIYCRHTTCVFMYQPFKPVRQPEDSNLPTDEKFKQKWNSSSKLCSPFDKFLMATRAQPVWAAGGVSSMEIMQRDIQHRLLSTGSRLLPHLTLECWVTYANMAISHPSEHQTLDHGSIEIKVWASSYWARRGQLFTFKYF